MMWRHRCNTLPRHLLNNRERLRFKIKDVDEEEVEAEDEVEDKDEEMEQQHSMVPHINPSWNYFSYYGNLRIIFKFTVLWSKVPPIS